MKRYASLFLGIVLGICAADGTLDNSFNGTGVYQTTFGNNAVANAAVIRNDGIIVIGGSIQTMTGANFQLLFLNAAGSPTVPASVHVGASGSSDEIFGLAVQPDNKIVAVGRSTLAGVSQFVVTRFCQSGILDVSFGNNGIVIVDFLIPGQTGPAPISAQALAVALTRDGRIVVAGEAQVSGSAPANPSFYAVAVLNTDGSLDNTFASGVGRRVYATNMITQNISSVANAVAIQSIGAADNIILAGSGEVSAGAHRFQIVRILPNGDLDLTFATNGVDQVVFNTGVNEAANGVAIYPNGTILAVGISQSTNEEAVLTRRLSNGGADNSFNGNGLVIFAQTGTDITANAVNIQNNGSVLFAGSYGSPSSFITARFTTAGAPDTATFNPPIGYALQSFNTGRANAIALQSNGEIIVAGDAQAGSQMGVLRYLNSNAGNQVFVAPTITSPANGFSNCSDNPPTLSGAAQNPSNITVYVNGRERGYTVTSGTSNTWSFTLPAALTVGSNTFQVVAGYKSGNMSAVSAFACCGVGLGPQSCISEAIREKYCASCPVTPISQLCNA